MPIFVEIGDDGFFYFYFKQQHMDAISFAFSEDTYFMVEQGAAGNSRRPSSFVSFWFHKVIGSGHGRFPAAVPELDR